MLKKNEISNILIVCGDPGGAKAVTPVIKKLMEIQSIQVHLYAYYKSVQVFQEEGFQFNSLSNEISEIEIKELFNAHHVDLLLVSTSENKFNLEKDFISTANRLEIPSLAILDFWANYSKRFSRLENDLDFLPSKIAVMDQMAYSEMEEEGFPPDRLVITGQPNFDQLNNLKSRFSAKDKFLTRKKMGVKEEDFFVVFISQPFSELFGESPNNDLYPGYDEKTIANNLCTVLDQVASALDKRINLLIIPHLREDEAWWDDLKTKHIKIIADKIHDPQPLILSADLVTGITSTKLVEAKLLGKDTYSLQIGAIASKIFDMERLGINKNIHSSEELKQVVERKLNEYGNTGEVMGDITVGSATKNVLMLIHEMLDEKISPSLINKKDLQMEVS